MNNNWLPLAIIGVLAVGAFAAILTRSTMSEQAMDQLPTDQRRLEKATFGSGCFWCTEAIFQEVQGVYQVISGYSGGDLVNPTYEQVCTGSTGHAEVVEITFDPAEVTYPELLEIFWRTHDPTTLNRQGADEGTQYRSVVYYHNEQQRGLAESLKSDMNDKNVFGAPVVTEISPASVFYSAEAYHQNFYARNPAQGYCQFVVVPKLQKFKQVFADKIKK